MFSMAIEIDEDLIPSYKCVSCGCRVCRDCVARRWEVTDTSGNKITGFHPLLCVCIDCTDGGA